MIWNVYLINYYFTNNEDRNTHYDWLFHCLFWYHVQTSQKPIKTNQNHLFSKKNKCFFLNNGFLFFQLKHFKLKHFLILKTHEIQRLIQKMHIAPTPYFVLQLATLFIAFLCSVKNPFFKTIKTRYSSHFQIHFSKPQKWHLFNFYRYLDQGSQSKWVVN